MLILDILERAFMVLDRADSFETFCLRFACILFWATTLPCLTSLKVWSNFLNEYSHATHRSLHVSSQTSIHHNSTHPYPSCPKYTIHHVSLFSVLALALMNPKVGGCRLVVNGVHQWPRIDYVETFDPVVKTYTLCHILSLVTFQR